jgi:hypothetical protein
MAKWLAGLIKTKANSGQLSWGSAWQLRRDEDHIAYNISAHGNNLIGVHFKVCPDCLFWLV